MKIFSSKSEPQKVKFEFLGSKFCPNKTKTQAIVEVYYSDLSYRVVTEEEAYPLKEMINEMAGITGLYFGFSFLSIITMIKGAIVTYKRKHLIKAQLSGRFSLKSWHKNPIEQEMDMENTSSTQ